jgi:carboxylesterase type B
MIAQRRKMAQVYTKSGQRAWSYRFDTPMWDAKPSDGSRHAIDLEFTFQNNTGLLGPLPQFQSHRKVSEGIGAAYISFVNRWDPNVVGSSFESALPSWPSYAEKPVNMVLNASHIHVEMDDWREEGMAFINTISRELLS